MEPPTPPPADKPAPTSTEKTDTPEVEALKAVSHGGSGATVAGPTTTTNVDGDTGDTVEVGPPVHNESHCREQIAESGWHVKEGNGPGEVRGWPRRVIS